MFTTNSLNYHPKQSLTSNFNLANNECLDQIQYYSIQISHCIKATTYFACIENFVLTKNITSLTNIEQQGQQIEKNLKQKKYDANFCSDFVNIIKQIKIKLLQTPNDKYTLVYLYENKRTVLTYLVWYLSKIENCLKTISDKLKINILVYNIEQINENYELILKNNFSIKSRNSLDIKIVQLEKRYHIMYSFTPKQIDRFYEQKKNKLCNQFSAQAMHLKRISELQKQLIQKTKQLAKVKNQLLQASNQLFGMKVYYQNKIQILQSKNKQLEKKQLSSRRKEDQITQIKQKQKHKTIIIDYDVTQYDQVNPQQQTNQLNVHQNNKTQIKNKYKCVDNNENNRHNNNNHENNEDIFKKQVKIKTNFLNISNKCQSSSQRVCQICQDKSETYSLFPCNGHQSCSKCLLRYIQTCLQNKQIPVCLNDKCGLQVSYVIVTSFLKDKKQKDMLTKLEDLYLNKYTSDKIFVQCKNCKIQIIIDNKEQGFFKHCGIQVCLKCNQQHKSNQRCGNSSIKAAINNLQFPNVCPNCHQIYDKDKGCDHLQCPKCKTKSGFCCLCSAQRSPILAHDNSFHRIECRYYDKNQQPARKQKDCLKCQKTPGASCCKQPEQTFRQFITTLFSQQIYHQIMLKRNSFYQTYQEEQ